jgi:hypothetical protein
MSKLRQLVELGHHFDPVRQALEVLRNLNRHEDHDEWDSYDWQDWREFNKKIRDRETRFGFDHHFRSTWFRLNSDLDNTASDFELSRNVTPFLEHIQAVIKAMVARCVKFPVRETGILRCPLNALQDWQDDRNLIKFSTPCCSE